MSIEDINVYLNKVVKDDLRRRKRYKGISKRNIRTAQVTTIALITEEPYKTETICFLVKNRPELVPKLCPYFITIKEIKKIENICPEIYYLLPIQMYIYYPYLINLLINNKLIVYDLLPKELRKEPKIQEIFKRNTKIYNQDLKDRLYHDKDFLDEHGNLRQYFKLKGDFSIQDKDDYLKIIDVYLTSNLSIVSFCDRYGISSIQGFKDLLKKAGYENIDVEEDINLVKDAASQKFLANVKSITSSIDLGKISFTDYLEFYYSPNHRFDLLFNNVKDKEIFVKQVIRYIMNNKENLMIERLMSLFNCSVGEIVKSITFYYNLVNIINPRINRNLYSVLNLYKRPYKRKDILSTITINGETYIIDDKVIDQTLTYLKNNNIYVCYYTVSNIAKKIAFGKIDYDFETEMAKEELKEEIIRIALSRAKTIEQYLQVMEENYHSKGI